MDKTILIIDDEEHMRNGLKDQLVKDGFKVKLAKTGKEGLDMALAEPPDMILLDYFIPQMSGLEVLQALRDNNRGKNIPVVVLTNMTDNEQTMQLQQYNVTDFLIKSDWTFLDISQRVKKHFILTPQPSS